MTSAEPSDPIDPHRVGAAVFDLGGVILAGGVESVRTFGERFGVATETWQALRRELFSDRGLWAAVERGERPFADFVAALRQAIHDAGGTVSFDDARQFLGRGDPTSQARRVRPEIVAGIERIRRRRPTALLTNNVVEWRDSWRSLIDCDRLFDVVIDSSEVGTRKPETAIYEITRERLGVAHEEIFFVDDQGPNLKTARALGWQTLKYEETERVVAVLESIASI